MIYYNFCISRLSSSQQLYFARVVLQRLQCSQLSFNNNLTLCGGNPCRLPRPVVKIGWSLKCVSQLPVSLTFVKPIDIIISSCDAFLSVKVDVWRCFHFSGAVGSGSDIGGKWSGFIFKSGMDEGRKLQAQVWVSTPRVLRFIMEIHIFINVRLFLKAALAECISLNKNHG